MFGLYKKKVTHQVSMLIILSEVSKSAWNGYK